MAKFNGRPDMVISIDFGMTYTGVAYCNISTGSDTVRHIQRWPGRTQANENKVPTLLVYPPNSSTPSSWGFLAETAQEHGGTEDESREWFKILLDEELLEQMRRNANGSSKIPSIHDVEQWYCDYFRALYQCIEARLKGELASRWEDAKIEFIFSVPTTWKPNPTVERFRKIVERAGFGQFPSHLAVIGLTEAEAAAVHTARNTPAIFKESDILFVCDVGGGTTDLSAFRVKNTANFGASLNLEQIDVVFGATVGAARLDSLFEQAVLERLQAANASSDMGLEDLRQTAWEMRICKEFQNAKCDYGSEESYSDTESFSVRVPKLERSYVNEQYGIVGGDMIFRRDDLQPFFDTQIDKLFDMIDKQLTRLVQKAPGQQVAHMILSGGLGNSAYVQHRLRSRYASGNSPHTNAHYLQIRVAPDPQLVVCKGNVADRVEKLKSGQSVLGWRCSRSSYGMLCKILYNPKNRDHIGLAAKRDVMDDKLYVMDHVDWFVKQGEPVSSDIPLVHNFSRKCPPASAAEPNPARIFPTEVVCSDVDASALPVVMNSACRSVCKIQSDFSSLPLSKFKLKNRHWWNSGPKYHRITFVVKVNIGPADIGFELWHEGVKLSEDNSITVEWHPSPPPDPNNAPVAVDIPMSSLLLNELPAVSSQKGGWNDSSKNITPMVTTTSPVNVNGYRNPGPYGQ